MICFRDNCGKYATKRARIVCYEPLSFKKLEIYINVHVCDDHGTDETAADLLQAGKLQIEQSFKAQGLTLPDWNRSYAEWVAIQ